MEPEVRFERIEATLALTAETHRRSMEEIDRDMARFRKRQEAAEKRQEAFEKTVRKLIVEGMRIVNHLAKENREARAETRALKAEVRAFIKAQGNGHRGSNGNGRR